MMNAKIAEMLNNQINKELFSAYLYLEMNNYFLGRGLPGFARWYQIQAMEEISHAMRINQYLHDENVSVTLKPIAQPTRNFQSDKEVLAEALEHEKYITSSIHSICDLALQLRDFRTLLFLDWFVHEQAEEEISANEMLDKWCFYGTNSQGLMLMDRELGKREYPKNEENE